MIMGVYIFYKKQNKKYRKRPFFNFIKTFNFIAARQRPGLYGIPSSSQDTSSLNPGVRPSSFFNKISSKFSKRYRSSCKTINTFRINNYGNWNLLDKNWTFSCFRTFFESSLMIGSICKLNYQPQSFRPN